MFERGAARVAAHLEARERRAWAEAARHMSMRTACELPPRATLAVAFAISIEILDPTAPCPPGASILE